MNEILTMRQISEHLPGNINPETIRLWVKEKKIPTLPRKKGGRIYFYKKSIEFWFENGKPEQGTMTDKEYSNLGMEAKK